MGGRLTLCVEPRASRFIRVTQDETTQAIFKIVTAGPLAGCLLRRWKHIGLMFGVSVRRSSWMEYSKSDWHKIARHVIVAVPCRSLISRFHSVE